VFRFQKTSLGLHAKLLNAVRISVPFYAQQQRGTLTVRASSDVDGVSSGNPAEAVEETKEETVAVENLPLESKLQEKLEQKVRMKLAKKLRLRRARLMRKRKMRKQGRWPPSKMRKNKNV
ncbi:hypothetical protein GIB67_024715, partial [Kingdonia uniflora]